MKNIARVNIYLGWILIFGIIITQIIITKVTLDMGRMAPFYAILTSIIFLPFILIAITSVLNPKKNLPLIKLGIKIGIFFQVGLPLLLPLFFDKELIYLSIFGLFLGLLMWYFRKKVEIQLLILNCIGVSIWLFISVIALFNNWKTNANK